MTGQDEQHSNFELFCLRPYGGYGFYWRHEDVCDDGHADWWATWGTYSIDPERLKKVAQR